MARPDPAAASPWFALARADRAVQDMILERADTSAEVLGLACFHGQQAAEKALKGVLTAWDQPAPRSHDLSLLCAAVARLVTVPVHVADACDALADYGVGPRYPLPDRLETRESAHAACDDAATVVVWCEAQVAE